jgi:hypothetical protein
MPYSSTYLQYSTRFCKKSRTKYKGGKAIHLPAKAGSFLAEISIMLLKVSSGA